MPPTPPVATHHYPFDCHRLQAIVREMMRGDPWFADPWEPAYGGMITAQISPNAYPLRVSWIQDRESTALTAALMVPRHTVSGLLGLGGRTRQKQCDAIHHFFVKMDHAVAQRIERDRIASAG